MQSNGSDSSVQQQEEQQQNNNQRPQPQQAQAQTPPPPQQQWMGMQYPAAAMVMQHQMMPPQHYMAYHQYQQQQQQHVQHLQQQQLGSSGGENKTIWVGDLHHWMDENYLHTCFASTGERRIHSGVNGVARPLGSHGNNLRGPLELHTTWSTKCLKEEEGGVRQVEEGVVYSIYKRKFPRFSRE